MDHYQCFECGMITSYAVLIKKTYKCITHNIKVEEDIIGRKFPCTLCPFTTRNMDELKEHHLSLHKKKRHNLMVEKKTLHFTLVMNVD